MRRSKYHIGRLRIRAAAILAANFPEWDVQPEDISPATGRHRTDWRQDVYRWELFARLKRQDGRPNHPVVCGCWETLTEFVRRAVKEGCHVNSDREICSGKDA